MNKNAAYLIVLCAGMFASICNVTAQTPQPPPAAYPAGTPVNYIRTWEATAPEQDGNTLMTRPVKDVKQATQYFDGLGRNLQVVVKEGSLETTTGIKTDMVNATVYDEFGREQYKYLPFVSTATNGTQNNGNFKLDPFQQQVTFMNAQYGSQNETFFYSKTEFEASPLGRINKTMAPGNSWVGSNRGAEAKYWINTATDAVRIWNVTDVANSFGTYSSPVTYNAGELYKTVTADEHGKQVIEFKDKENKVILKKIQLTATADDGTGRDNIGWLCTYYIYDDLNNLRCVVQPRGAELLATNNWQLTTPLLDEQCFRYEYDARGRMIIKKVPGAGEVYMVYDTRDRLVMAQDANMRTQNKWMITKYDAINRPSETGLWNNDGNSFTTHLFNAYNNSTGYPNTTSGYELLTVTHYDDYTNLPAGLSDYLTTWNTNFSATNNSAWPYPQMPQKSIGTKGMVTWTQTAILSPGGGAGGGFLNTVSYYDDKGRVIQIQSTNSTGGTDAVTTQYTWAGQPLVTVQRQQKSSGTAQEHIVITKMQYDDAGRVLKIKKTVNSTIGALEISKPEQLIVSNEYDKLGQLKKKTLGAGALETLNYDYNIRGWMLGMNRDYTKDLTTTNYFGFDLGYDKQYNNIIGNQPYANPQYNGNIEGMVWKSKGDGEKRKYDFNYDAANRILNADFNQYTSNSFNKTASVDFSMSGMGYDANGNILTMNQKGLKINSSPTIDQLSYTYQSNSNKLQQVTDAANDNTSKLGDFKYDPATKTATDYNYDANGNLTLDNNKKISSITYNHLNMPQTITVSPPSGGAGGGGTIVYTYDAAGNKLQKTTTDNTVTPTKITTTLYINGAVYENDVLQFIGHEEGRIRFNATNNTLQHDYMIKDHLGNVRVVLTEEQQTDMYPAATMEITTINTEQTYYGNLTNTQLNKPSFFSDPVYTTNAKVARIKNATGIQKVGPNMILKVMAGDSYSLRVASGWSSASSATNSPTNVLADLLNLLSTGAAGVSGGKATGAELQNAGSGLNSALSTFMGTQTTSGTKPKAYINWILLDEQFKVVTAECGFQQVGSSGTTTIHTRTNIPINKSGYLYVYTSNEATNIDVYFDNLQVTHIRGALLETNEFYPFGLQMANLCYRALKSGYQENKFLYNGKEEQSKEFSDGSGLELLDYGNRMYDAQIGRFFTQDRFASKYFSFSPYQYAANNPIKYIDVNGDSLDVSKMLTDVNSIIVLAKIMMDLQKTSGLKLTVTNGKLITNGKLDTKDKVSAKAADYLTKITGDSKNNIVLTNDNSKSTGRTIGTDNVNINSDQIFNNIQALEDAGQNGMAYGFGFSFLHESLHTWSGTFAMDPNATMNMQDPANVQANWLKNSPVEENLNEFRNELGLPERQQYFWQPQRTGATMEWMKDGKTITVTKTTMSEDEKMKRMYRGIFGFNRPQ
jgi:RHS repeat-associated protein